MYLFILEGNVDERIVLQIWILNYEPFNQCLNDSSYIHG